MFNCHSFCTASIYANLHRKQDAQQDAQQANTAAKLQRCRLNNKNTAGQYFYIFSFFYYSF